MDEKVTNIQIVPVKPKDGLVGFVSFIFADQFYFGSIGVYTKPHGGFRLTYPTRKIADQSLPIFHPINKNIATEIENAVIEKFEQVINGEL